MATKNAWDALTTNIAIANRADRRTIEAHKLQKMSLALPHYWSDTWKASPKYSNDTWTLGFDEESGAHLLYIEANEELAKYYQNNIGK